MSERPLLLPRRRVLHGLGAAAALAAFCPIARGAAAPRLVALTSALRQPWGMAFLPDGRMLVTQKAGSMVIVSADGATVGEPLAGLPGVAAAGQGGLLDVALDPDFAGDPWVYFSYAEPGSGSEAGLSGTAVARGRLAGNALREVAVIFRQAPKVSGNGHFGSRLVFRGDKTLFVTLGERQKFSPAQDLASHLGKVVRIQRDGSVPADNPKLGANARPEIWSYGHRNVQGAALHPQTGELWACEHGPQGGDELNVVRAGRNHGWPLRSYGCHYGEAVGEGCAIGGGKHAPGFIDPVTTWVPTSIAPSGLAFCTSDRIPAWRGQLFTGALAGKALWRIELAGETVASRERLFAGANERIRCVTQGPDGWLYLLAESGKLLRITV
jgi:glucose/arabinose dehydrogenase